MKISRVYANDSDLFAPIDFHHDDRGPIINVIYGDVLRPDDREQDSHNLGKTTLLHLLEFLMLKGTAPEQFLVKHLDRFERFDFYIEIALNSGEYASVRRSPHDPNSIALLKHAESGQDLVDAADDTWDHVNLSLQDAIALLDGWLDLRVLSPYNYRKAITYFLRAQGDYEDELQLQKFRSGKDVYWKPFVAHLFGFKEAPVRRKYELDDAISQLKDQFDLLQSEVQYKEDDLPELNARITALRQSTNEIEDRIDAFSFDTEERILMTQLVEQFEGEIAEINQALYETRFDKQQINSALGNKDKFDIKSVAEAFEEANINFPGQLKRGYDELIDFNRKVTRERDAALRKKLKALEGREVELRDKKRGLDSKRSANLRILRSTDTFEKFKEIQKNLSEKRAQVVYLEQQRDRLISVADAAQCVRATVREREVVIDELKAMVAKQPTVLSRFQEVFSGYCQRVLNHEGLFYVQINSNNNLDYGLSLGLKGQRGKRSSQSEGTSYKKLVCALFDLALLTVYRDRPFFHFVYHDGILEGLDDRKKAALLDLVRELVADGSVQYILTLIKSDLPRDSDGQSTAFSDEEIVLRLHDEGDSGRLFRMAEF